MKRSVVHLTFASRSGAARYVFHLVKAIVSEGLPLVLIAPVDYTYSENLRTLPNICVRQTLPTIEGQFSRAQKIWRSLLRTLVASVHIGLLGLGRGRVVHINFVDHPLFSLPLFLFLRLTGWKILLTVHDVLPHRWLLPRPLRWLERASYLAMYRLSTGLVVHHLSQKAELVGAFRVRPRTITVVPHGVFELAEEPLEFPPADEMRVLIFGVIRRNKGIHLAIKAVQELRSKGKPIRLLIAGRPYASESRYWMRCKQLIARSPEGIDVFEGYIPEEELLDLFAKSHVLLLPYQAFHSQSGVAIMAMSNGRAIIATNVGGLAGLVVPNETGILIPEPTVEGVKEALLEALARFPAELERMGYRAWTYVRERYSWDIVGGKHVRLYNQLFRRPRREVG